jgi:hypothetical protein
VASAAYLVCSATHAATTRPWRFPPVYCALGGLTALSLQQHPYFFDPTLVAGYVGLPATAMGMVVLGSCLRALSEPTLVTRSSALLVGTAIVGSMFYETVDTAIAAAAVLMLVHYLRHRDDRSRTMRLALAAVGAPALISILGQIYVASLHPPHYAGTQVLLSSRAIHPIAALSANLVPGSAWPLIFRTAGGFPAFGMLPLLCAVGILVLGALAIRLFRREDFPPPDRWKSL